MLVNGLPPEAATWRVDGQQWTRRDELLAALVERVDQWGWANVQVQSGGKALKNYEPLQVERPTNPAEREKKDRVVTDAREIAKFFS